MDNIVWNRPMIVLNNIVIMPDTSSHLDVISKESCEAVANAMKGDCKDPAGYGKGSKGE